MSQHAMFCTTTDTQRHIIILITGTGNEPTYNAVRSCSDTPAAAMHDGRRRGIVEMHISVLHISNKAQDITRGLGRVSSPVKAGL